MLLHSHDVQTVQLGASPHLIHIAIMKASMNHDGEEEGDDNFDESQMMTMMRIPPPPRGR